MKYSRLFSLFIVLIIPSILGSGIPQGLQIPQNHISYNNSEKVEWTLANINNLASWISWDGASGVNPLSSEAGTWYPRSTSTVVYQDGLLWGGFVRDGTQPELRVGGQHYVTGTVPGKILSQGIAEDPNDPALRIYRIRRDYQTVSDEELLPDAAEFFNVPLSRVTSLDLKTLREQYALDWQEWPTDRGAPYYDNNFNGIYEPLLGEEPGLQNADQVIWLVCNDLDPSQTHFLNGSPPIGLELQVTVWGYKVGGALGQTIFRRYRLINKSGVAIDSMFVTQFSDVDLGSFGDDLCGCDSVMNQAYAYNGYPSDQWFIPFNLPPPAIGYCLLQGPVVPSPGDTAFYNFGVLKDFRSLPMTSFHYDPTGNAEWDFPDIGEYDGTLQWYNIMNGYLPISDMYRQTPFTHRATGNPTKFPLNGDPGAGTGDIDGQALNFYAGARIISFSSGPFQMLPGDTQEVVIAMIGGIDQAGDNISSVSRLQENVREVRNTYQDHLILPKTNYQLDFPSATNSRLQMEVNLSDFENLTGAGFNFRPEKGNESEFQMDLYDDGMHGDGTAGDGNWSNIIDVANRQYPYQGDLFIYYSTAIDTITGLLTNLQLRPSPEIRDFSIVYENGRQDGRINYGETVHLAFRVENLDGLNSIQEFQVSTLSEEEPLFYAYHHDQEILAGSSISSPNLYAIVSAPAIGDSVSFRLLLQFDDHLELYQLSYPIFPWQPAEIWQDTLQVEAISGPSDNVLVKVADPTLLTGHEYLLTFSENPDTSEGNHCWNLLDLNTGEMKLKNQPVVDSLQSNHPVVDGLEYQVYNPELDFRQFLVVANAVGILDPPDQGCFAFHANGFPFLFNDRYPAGADRPTRGVQQSTNNSTWGIHTGMNNSAMDPSFEFFKQRVTREGSNWEQIDRSDYELRFTANGGKAQMAFTTGTVVDVPFELWNTGISTPDDPSDDYRLIPYINDADGNEVFNLLQADHSLSGYNDDPYTDWIYWWEPLDKTPGQSGYEASLANDFIDVEDEIFARIVLVNWDGGWVPDPSWPANVNAVMPEEGTIFRIITTKPNQIGDSLLVRAPAAQPDILYDWPQQFQLLQNYPNPFNSGTTIPFELSEDGKVRIEIYNILGQQVVVLKDEPMKKGRYSLRWDGKNSSGIPIASGVYVVRMEIKDIVMSRKMVLLR